MAALTDGSANSDGAPAPPLSRPRGAGLGAAVLRRLPRMAGAIAAGLLLCVSFPPFGWWYTAIVAFALLAWVLTHESTTQIGGLGYGLLFGIAFYVSLLPWTSSFVGVGPWLALAGMESVFPALFGAGAVLVRRLPGWPIWVAAVWAVQEWAKSNVPFGGFPWGAVGFGQTDGPFLPIAQIGGVPLVSFAVVLLGVSMAALASEVTRWWRLDAAGAGHAGPPAIVLPGAYIGVVLLATAVIWPQVRQPSINANYDPLVTVAAVQGNVPRLGLDFNAQRRAVLDNHVRETLRLADEVRAGRAAQPQIVVWPENSSDVDPLANPDAAERITIAARAIEAPILVGGVLAGPGYSSTNPVTLNSVIVWDPVGGPSDRHDKQIVQPFGEYLPWRGFFRLFSSSADRAGYFVPGDGSGVVRAAGVPIGVVTCWEVIFDRAARESVLNGAQLLTVPSNNATFGEAMSEQQLAFAKLRAVEHNRYVVVAATTGISSVVGPDGRELARTGFFEPAYLDTPVRLMTGLTPATRWGPVVQWLLISIGIVACIASIILRRSPTHRVSLRRRTPRTHTSPPAMAPRRR
ncbi:MULTISPECIES: apolipoprotein N-acyltransferase [Mycolicibacterium]|nr:apolipoprotein N-acyltransferase [Mycolicibacterium monacense]OBB75839.1 apolipoprotein N-acyltransferase [Mycolicibacterium monacense]OBF54061.1 apolipoprotein N-acyltransferase [Mycolicibacterium monacense]ORB16423.1 apolipoprotein N-acyltransferase [Mycolicibacterium monacense DSM 44395]ORV43679.1 apolipoprotein N-acyltransferase [Mycolicibacterium doricum]